MTGDFSRFPVFIFLVKLNLADGIQLFFETANDRMGAFGGRRFRQIMGYNDRIMLV
jgi:hypothetical protein